MQNYKIQITNHKIQIQNEKFYSRFKVGCCTNVLECTHPTLGIINSQPHDDRVHWNLGQMPLSSVVLEIGLKLLSFESACC